MRASNLQLVMRCNHLLPPSCPPVFTFVAPPSAALRCAADRYLVRRRRAAATNSELPPLRAGRRAEAVRSVSVSRI